jgi:hypothetical protein
MLISLVASGGRWFNIMHRPSPGAAKNASLVRHSSHKTGFGKWYTQPWLLLPYNVLLPRSENNRHELTLRRLLEGLSLE